MVATLRDAVIRTRVGCSSVTGERPALDMGIFPHTPVRARTATVLALLTSVVMAGAAGATHPSLPNPEKANCTACHDEILAQEFKHAPATEGCLSCHAFARQGEQTVVTLASPQPALCVTCHDALAKAADGTLPAPHAPVGDSCGNCHLPHSGKLPHLLKARGREMCVTCHSVADLTKSHKVPVARADCAACHASHGSTVKGMLLGSVVHAPFEERSCEACHRRARGTRIRTTSQGADLCYACHDDLRTKFSGGSVHTPVRNGECTGCHDPHLAAQAKLLRAKGNAVCFSCHADIERRASGAGAHAPAKEACNTCHDPHRSPNRAQLSEALPALCLTCHDAADKGLKAKHLGADLTKTACTGCHDPHGSKGKHLVADASVHEPFASGACDSCHEGSAGKVASKGSKELCYACHGDIKEQAGTAKVPHAAMEAAECTACHVPHASPRSRLLKADGAALCADCHADQVAKSGETSHGAIERLGCQSCHRPHGGNAAKLLKVAGNTLCTGCHLKGQVKPAADGSVVLADGQRLAAAHAKQLRLVDLDPTETRNHPIPGHPVSGKASGTSKTQIAKSLIGQETTCLSCHVPHAAPTSSLLAFKANSAADLCLSCHPK